MHLVFAVLLALTQQWLIVSDLHVNPFDRASEPAAYQEDTNWVLFDSALAQMRKSVPDPQVVVIDGDFLAHDFAAKVHAADAKLTVPAAALRTMTRIESSFGRAFPHSQFLIAMGNNDDACGDYRTAPDTPYLARLAHLWAPLVDRNNAAPAFVRDFSHAGSYTAQLPDGLRAVVVDDVPWSFVYRGCGKGAASLPDAQLSWLANKLASVPATQRAAVVLHIPPGVDVSTTLRTKRFIIVPYQRGDLRARVSQIVSANGQQVAFVIAGHTHHSDFRIAGGAPMLVAPSISPIYSNNPAFLVLEVDSSGIARDYQMYAFDENSNTWSRFFDFDSAYGVRAFTTGSLRNVHERLFGDDALRSRWESTIVARREDYDVRQSWRAYWCAQTQLDGGSYAACAGDVRRVTLLRIVLVLLVLAIVLVLVFVVKRLARQRKRA